MGPEKVQTKSNDNEMETKLLLCLFVCKVPHSIFLFIKYKLLKVKKNKYKCKSIRLYIVVCKQENIGLLELCK